METLKTVLYFSIFRYPLKIKEIHSYTNHKHLDDTSNEVQHLIDKNILTKIDEFYVYANDLESVSKRIKGNIQAKKTLIKANQRAKFISYFPYVEAVGVSGSLSKGYYDDSSDIDFFVITEPNKLWICRTLLMLYKKIFLLNSKKYFCINYFITTKQLEIKEQNRFTATELKTLIPMQGKAVFENFYKNNQWVTNYFSKFNYDLSNVANTKKPALTKAIEFMFDNRIGGVTDAAFKTITFKKWKSKFHSMSEDDFKIALKSTNNISKHHPSNFQKKVILSLNLKLEEVQNNYNIIIQKENV